ncbi:MAG: enoyl-CoA hydratase/isomerase family protein [Vicinamibacterales bacterium]
MELTNAAVVRLPAKLTPDTVHALRSALDGAMADSSAVVVLIGASEDTFCTGLAVDEGGPVETEPFAAILATLSDAPKPTLAFVDGRAIGGGFGMACACDWLVATERATFGLPELLWGILPAMIWPAVSARLGANTARRWTISAHTRTASQALDAGVVDELVSSDRADAALRRTIRTLARLEPAATRALRRWSREAQEGPLAAILARGAALTRAMAASRVVQARVAAFTRGETPWISTAPLVVTDVDARGIATITMNDPAASNALGEAMVHELIAAFDYAGGRDDVRAVVLTGSGPTFSAGAPVDLLLRLVRGELEPADITLPRALLGCPVPVIAAVAGHAVGGGFALALAADIIVLASECRYGFTFMNYGFTPGMGTTRLCEHALSPAVAHELLYSGELRRGDRFSGSGINHVVPREAVIETALDIAARIAEKPRTALELLKRTLATPRRTAFEEALTVEAQMHEITMRAPGVEARITADYR